VSLQSNKFEEELNFLQNQIKEKQNKIKGLDNIIDEKNLKLSKIKNIEDQLISKEFVNEILKKKKSVWQQNSFEENLQLIQSNDSAKISQLEAIIEQLTKE
jgi:hypothetical protein